MTLRLRLARALVVTGAAVLALPPAAPGQEVERKLRALDRQNARLYARPITAGLGPAMNSGWHRGANVRGPLQFSVDFPITAAFVPVADERFRPRPPQSITVEMGGEQRTYEDPYGTAAGRTTPSVAGPEEGVVLLPMGQFREDLQERGESLADFALRFPDGLDLSAIPVLAPQATLGLVKGTEVSVRWIPSLEVTEVVGPAEGFGLGGQHSVSQWLPEGFPLDVAVAAGFQELEVGDYLSAESRTAQLSISESLSILTLYVAGGLEDSDVEISYAVEDPVLPGTGGTVSFRDGGANERRFTVGLSLDLLFLEMAADYTVSEYDVVHASVGVGM